MSQVCLSLTTEGKVATIGLSRPPLNIINLEMMKQLDETLQKLSGDRSIHVVVIGSAVPGVFSAGADVKEHLPETADRLITVFGELISRMVRLEIPTVAVVGGKCLGGGMELALACDFVLAEEAASFGQPEVNVGVYPPVAAALYPRMAGLRNSYRILLTGDTIAASDAKSMGLVTEVVRSGEMEAELQKLLASLTRQSRAVLGFTKRAINENISLSPDEAIRESSKLYLEGLMKTDDAKEGLTAFIEKRRPEWRDR